MAVPPKQILPSSGAATTQQPQQPKKKGTGFTNLQRVMQASQGSKLGQTIAGGITGQAQQVQSGVKSAQEEFEKKAEQERLDSAKNKELVASGIQQAAQSGDISSDTSNLFERVRAGEYKGPTGLTDTQRLYSQAQQAQQLGALASGIGGDAATRAGGRQELLRRFAGGSDYTLGQRKLDESILARDKEANLAAAARQTRGAAQDVERAGQVAQAKGQEYSNLAKLFAKQTGEQLGAAQEDIIQREVEPELQKAVARDVARKDLLKEISDLEKSSSELGAVGLRTPAEKQEALTALLKKATESGYLSQEELNFLSPLERNIAGEPVPTPAYDPASGFLSRASSLAYDPVSALSSLIASKSQEAQNLSTAGMAAKLGNLSRLGALEKLAGRTGLDAKYGEGTQAFKEGTAGLEDIDPFKQQVLEKEIPKFEKDLNTKQSEMNSIENKLSKDWLYVLGGKKRGQVMEMLRAGNPEAREWVLSAATNNKEYKLLERFLSQHSEAMRNRNQIQSDLDKANKFKKELEQKRAISNVQNPDKE